MASDFDSVTIGDMLPSLSLRPLTRAMLASYAEASGDPNPIHIDADVARAAGCRMSWCMEC
jgi:acyl dehydratase